MPLLANSFYGCGYGFFPIRSLQAITPRESKMKVIAYSSEADHFCLTCTENLFPNMEGTDSDPVQPVFSTDEWYEADEDVLEENQVQHLVCEYCHDTIDTYTHNTESV